ncbi:hypothetical protein K490DRAFT_60946 [Saccharata proteae CBS 121410]|uniref:Uncharacterized protein n=1 Tax=Saccharata proteae CBS 121410 TaxID=1314787 RepID=A0A9P4I1M7_9PEZI|nr:hypothetical protein K490DRAFT_60946 [Saccharata proteae CBS 121410]
MLANNWSSVARYVRNAQSSKPTRRNSISRSVTADKPTTFDDTSLEMTSWDAAARNTSPISTSTSQTTTRRVTSLEQTSIDAFSRVAATLNTITRDATALNNNNLNTTSSDAKARDDNILTTTSPSAAARDNTDRDNMSSGYTIIKACDSHHRPRKAAAPTRPAPILAFPVSKKPEDKNDNSRRRQRKAAGPIGPVPISTFPVAKKAEDKNDIRMDLKRHLPVEGRCSADDQFSAMCVDLGLGKRSMMTMSMDERKWVCMEWRRRFRLDWHDLGDEIKEHEEPELVTASEAEQAEAEDDDEEFGIESFSDDEDMVSIPQFDGVAEPAAEVEEHEQQKEEMMQRLETELAQAHTVNQQEHQDTADIQIVEPKGLGLRYLSDTERTILTAALFQDWLIEWDAISAADEEELFTEPLPNDEDDWFTVDLPKVDGHWFTIDLPNDDDNWFTVDLPKDDGHWYTVDLPPKDDGHWYTVDLPPKDDGYKYTAPLPKPEIKATPVSGPAPTDNESAAAESAPAEETTAAAPANEDSAASTEENGNTEETAPATAPADPPLTQKQIDMYAAFDAAFEGQDYTEFWALANDPAVEASSKRLRLEAEERDREELRAAIERTALEMAALMERVQEFGEQAHTIPDWVYTHVRAEEYEWASEETKEWWKMCRECDYIREWVENAERKKALREAKEAMVEGLGEALEEVTLEERQAQIVAVEDDEWVEVDGAENDPDMRAWEADE